MKKRQKFLSEVRLNGQPLADLKLGQIPLRDRHLLKEFLDYTHLKKGLLEPYAADYPLVEPRELLPSFEKNFAEYKQLPSFSMVAFNRPLSYQDETFQFDLLHPLNDGKRRSVRENLDKILPHLDRDFRAVFKSRFTTGISPIWPIMRRSWPLCFTWTGPTSLPGTPPRAISASWESMPPSRRTWTPNSRPWAAAWENLKTRTAPLTSGNGSSSTSSSWSSTAFPSPPSGAPPPPCSPAGSAA